MHGTRSSGSVLGAEAVVVKGHGRHLLRYRRLHRTLDAILATLTGDLVIPLPSERTAFVGDGSSQVPKTSTLSAKALFGKKSDLPDFEADREYWTRSRPAE